MAIANYIETDPSNFFATGADVWEKYDLLSNKSVPASTESSPVVAEILLTNIFAFAVNFAGVRSTDSILDRRFRLVNPQGGGIDAVSIFVPVDTSGNIEIYSDNTSQIAFSVLGYWQGASYTEDNNNFQSTQNASWVNYDLGSGYANSVAEIVISNSNTVLESGGVRSVGSSYNRYHEICRGITLQSDRVTMHVNTSGANGTIQIFASSSGDINFTSVGRWDNSFADYNETFIASGDTTANNVWQQSDIGMPNGSVVEMVAENRSRNSERFFGIREIGSSFERIFELRQTNDTSDDLSADMYRSFVNISSGTHVELQTEATGIAHRFVSIGYWDNFTQVTSSINDSIDLFIHGHETYNILQETNYPSGLPLYTNGMGIPFSGQIDLYMSGVPASTSGNINLSTFGVNVFRTDSEFSVNYPSGLSLYTTGFGIIPVSGQFDLFITGQDNVSASGDLFTEGHDDTSGSMDLFLKTIEQTSGQVTLYLHNPIDPGSGIVREADAIFYLSRRHHDATDTAIERVESLTWDFPSILIGNRTFLDQSGATTTVGDGTLPQYNDMGGGFSSCAFGSAQVGSIPLQQVVLGSVISPADYQYTGSGSMTTAFWMSGAKTSGNIVDAGWFYHPGNFGDLVNTQNDHTIGIKITSGNGIQVRTSVRDLPYDQLTTGDLWWGGTTHYGTPTGSDWTWRSASEYWAWDEEWPEVSIAHNDVAFFLVRSEFIASGVVSGITAHMNVYLSVDGLPWTFIGSGATGPPASSLWNSSNPRNRHAENAVGFKVQAVNSDFNDESLAINEVVLWSDSDRLRIDEITLLHSLATTYYRPLDEYKPTLVPPSTYIRRTVGPFVYQPIVPSSGFNPVEVSSGLKVTLEVGIGAYGEDASAYLLEETPPSGFFIRNISPHTNITYPLQGTRPNTQQQIFHDPESGIMQPYDTNFGVNSYGASIRWINHDNHPQKDERRIPTPTGIFTYDLFPVSEQGSPPIDSFSFTGSGIFFNGSTGSGIFNIETTGDTSGTTSGVLGGVKNNGFDLYISGPGQVNGSANLYLRTQEKFTSAFIGDAPRTPEAVDFVFEADGAAALQSLAGIEYGPNLYIKGPLQFENSFDLFITGPIGDDITLFVHGFDTFNTSGSYPSGLPLVVKGHEVASGSMDLFLLGPVPHSGNISLYTRAGEFNDIDLFTHGHLDKLGAVSGFIKGPEFITTSGNFDYPLDETLFKFPSGGQSPDLYIKGPEFIVSSGSFPYPGDPTDFSFPYGDPSPTLYIQAFESASGTVPLFIGPLKVRESWTLYLKTEDNNPNQYVDMFTHGFIPSSGSSGVNQTFNNMPLYLEAADADYPFTAGGIDSWTLFLKVQDGNLTDTEAWTMFLKADSTTTNTCDFVIYGHASGQLPHGLEFSSSMNMVCSADPDDPDSIGFIPFDSDDDPWTLFLKVDPGHFGTVDMFISGATPITHFASGDLFIRGLFEQEYGTVPLYLMGVSGLINNGPNGLPLFLNAGVLVYNTSGNLYIHGY